MTNTTKQTTTDEAVLAWYRNYVKTYLEAVSPDLVHTVEEMSADELREMADLIQSGELEE